MSTIASKKKRLRELVGTGTAHGVNIALGELDENGLDKLIDKGDELRAAVIQTITTKARELSTSDKYKDEEEESKYGYLSGYKKPKDLTAQANRLRELFSGLGFANLDYQAKIEKGEVKLPAGAEGWFAIPNWVKNEKIFGKTYSEAVQKVLDTIKKTRSGKFYNYREGSIDEKHLRQSARKEKFLRELSEAHGNPDILIVPGQFGIRHRGRSVRRALEVMNSSESGLGAFENGIMLLTHEDRLKHYDDLWIDCAGDEFSPEADGDFSGAPFFGFYVDGVKFGTGYVVYANDFFGSSSGFLPQN
jgi:hypothetical protein